MPVRIPLRAADEYGNRLYYASVIRTTKRRFISCRRARGTAPPRSRRARGTWVDGGPWSCPVLLMPAIAESAIDESAQLIDLGLDSINAVTWSSTKFDHRAPEGYALLRVFYGGARSPQMMAHGDNELVTIVRAELAAIMGVKAEPVLAHINRWWEANPQYDTGHLDHVAAIEAALPAGLAVSGSAYRGVGIPDCVRQAKETVTAVVEGVTAGGD